MIKITTKFLIFSGLFLSFFILFPISAQATTLGRVNTSNLNVRDMASISDSNVLFQLDYGQEVEITGAMGDFYQINTTGAMNVFAAREYVDIISYEGNIMYEMVWLLESPPGEEGAAIINVVTWLDSVLVSASSNGWHKVTVRGFTGYIPGFSVALPFYTILPEERAAAPNNFITGSGLALDITEYAKTLIGSRYRAGGTTPEMGFDCSGYVSYVLAHFDINVGRSSRDMALHGTRVEKSGLQMGDLVFFALVSGSSTISHVGLYIGNGEFIHSTDYSTGVIISSLDEPVYTRGYVMATRIL